MVTILGQHISLVRPSNRPQPKIYKDERPVIRYNQRAKTILDHTGKVAALCIRLINNEIKSLPVPSTHVQVCEKLDINLNEVASTGWQLENGNYLWR